MMKTRKRFSFADSSRIRQMRGCPISPVYTSEANSTPVPSKPRTASIALARSRAVKPFLSLEVPQPPSNPAAHTAKIMPAPVRRLELPDRQSRVLRTIFKGLSLSNCGVVAALAFAAAAGAATIPLTKITATGETPQLSSGYPADKFGASVAVSADGSTAVVGGFGDNGGRGAVWFFDHDAGGWRQLPKLTNTATVGAAWFGDSVALSADGHTAIVGAPLDNVNVGSAWIYTRTSADWELQAKLTGSEPSSAVEDGFGI